MCINKEKKDPELEKIMEIVKYSECNIKTALWCLQFYILGYEHTTNYDSAILSMTKLILLCNLNKIEDIRDAFFNIWITNYEGIKIVRDILRQIISEPSLSENCKANIIIRTSEIEYNMLRGRRQIIHFDSFVTSVMKIIKDDNNKSNIKVVR